VVFIIQTIYELLSYFKKANIIFISKLILYTKSYIKTYIKLYILIYITLCKINL